MSDKEVGELWDLAKDARPSPSDDLVTIRRLIRKLVEERARVIQRDKIMLRGELEPHFQQSRDAALRDFGIDPATWETKP